MYVSLCVEAVVQCVENECVLQDFSVLSHFVMAEPVSVCRRHAEIHTFMTLTGKVCIYVRVHNVMNWPLLCVCE